MPRVKPLTPEMREQEALKQVSTDLLDRMNEIRGRRRMTNQDFAVLVGVSYSTWKRWNLYGGLASSEFAIVVLAAVRSGLKVHVEV